MAKKKKNNRYNNQAKKKSIMQKMGKGLDTKGSVKNTVLETGKDLLIGVIGGGLVGAAMGRASLGVGAIITGAGHYADNKLAAIFGMGMMAANGFQKSKGVNGLEGMDGVKERLNAYKDNFAEKLFIDKLISKKVVSANGVGEVQFFTYPSSVSNDLAALDYIENKITESGLQQMQMTGGNYELDMAGIEADEIIL